MEGPGNTDPTRHSFSSICRFGKNSNCRSASKSSRAGPMLKVLALGIRCLIQGVAKRLTRPVVVSLRWALPRVVSNCKQFNFNGVSDKIREHVAEWRWQRRVARWAGQGC